MCFNDTFFHKSDFITSLKLIIIYYFIHTHRWVSVNVFFMLIYLPFFVLACFNFAHVTPENKAKDTVYSKFLNKLTVAYYWYVLKKLCIFYVQNYKSFWLINKKVQFLGRYYFINMQINTYILFSFQKYLIYIWWVKEARGGG